MLHWIAAARASLVPRATRAGSLLVDIGCGAGVLAPHVAHLGHRHVGVDVVAASVHQAEERGVTVRSADARGLPLADGCADVVVAGEVLEHVPDLDLVVAEAIRVLRPGGTLVIDTIAATWWGRFTSITVGERMPAGPPPRLHDPDLYVDRTALVVRVRSARSRADASSGCARPPRTTSAGSSPVEPRYACSPRPSRQVSSRLTAPRRRRDARDAQGGLAAARALAPALAARAADHDRDGRLPRGRLRRPARGRACSGLMAPTALGGAGAGFAEYAEVAMALAAGNGATALVFNMHCSIVGALASLPDEMARALGVPESYFAMRDRVLSDAARGAFYAVAMSERGSGSRLSGVTTTYEPKGSDGYLIRGSKTFCSGAGSCRRLPRRRAQRRAGELLPRAVRAGDRRRADLGLAGDAGDGQPGRAPRRRRAARQPARRRRGAHAPARRR